MKIVKRTIALLIMFLMLFTITFAEETKTVSFKVTVSDGDVTVEETELISDIDNSDLLVKVTKVTDNKESVIYEGILGEYDNGLWAFTDFSDIDFLVIFDWESMENEAIYIVPVSKLNDNKSSITTEASETTEIQNTVDMNATRTETVEQPSPISATQLIEYDITYRIVSDDSLSMDIDYNVYNGNSENDTVSLIAALYENGRLSDIKTQSLSIDALDSNTDNILLPLSNNRENYSVKLMVWDGMGTLRPIGNAKQVVDLDDYAREKYMYITSNANVGFNVYMNAATVKGANDDAVHTLKYDSTKITPVDLCGFTYNKELTAGEILNTNITIQNADLSAGKIEYKFNLEAGRNTGITNLVKFKTLCDLTDEVIIYTIQ